MRSALVGTGAIARQHLGCLAQLPGVELVGVCDLSRVSAQWAAERHGAQSWFTDYGEMLAHSRPDVVHITTPVTSHFALATAALDADAHVIVEKPLTVDDEELQRLLDHADHAGRYIVEDYNYLFNPPVEKALALAQRGDLGDLLHAEATFYTDIMQPGSPFTDPDAPHAALALPGGPVGDFATHLAAFAYATVGAHRTVRTTWSDEGRGDGVNTGLLALVDAEHGTAVLGFSARTRPSGMTLRLSGSTRSATAAISGHRVMVEEDAQWRRPVHMGRRAIASTLDAARGALAAPWERLAGGPGLYIGIWTLIERTYDALRQGNPPPVSRRQITEINRLRSAILAQEGAA